MTTRRSRGEGGLHFDESRQRWIATAALGFDTALHRRIAKIGTIPEFLRWFDALQAGEQSTVAGAATTTISHTGQLDLAVIAGTVPSSLRSRRSERPACGRASTPPRPHVFRPSQRSTRSSGRPMRAA